MKPDFITSKYIDFSLKECGREKCIPNKKFEFTPKGYHILHFVVSGKGYYVRQDEKDTNRSAVKRGAVFYIPPGEKSTYYPDGEDPWTYVWVGFDGIKAKTILSAIGLTPEKPIFHYGKSSGIIEQIEAIYATYRDLDALSLKCLGLFYILLQDLYELSEKKESKELTVKQMHVKEAREFIINNYDQPIAVTDVANSLDLSPNYLSNIFSEVLGISPKQFLTEYRISMAKQFLRSNSFKIKQVGEHVGYRNQLHFSAEFKKAVGMSPLEYSKTQEGS